MSFRLAKQRQGRFAMVQILMICSILSSLIDDNDIINLCQLKIFH